MYPRPTASSEAPADLVGRDPERARLRDIVEFVATGRGAAALLAGEPGIGKTRLARDALDLARAHGFRVMEGRSDPLSRGVAYGSVIHAVRPVLRALSPADRRRVLADLPALGLVLPGMGIAPAEPVEDAAMERTRLFEAVLRLVDRLSRDAPLAMFLDDLHLADRSTLQLLAYVAREIPGLPVLMLAAYQPSDGNGDLGDFVAALRRTAAAEEIMLGALAESELEQLAAGVLGGEAPADVSRFLAARANGNPLFARALIDQLRQDRLLVEVDGSWQVAGPLQVSTPFAIREAMTGLLARLPPDERRIVDLISVGGDGVDLAVITEVAGSDPGRTLDALERGGVIVGAGVPAVACSIGHPLLREVAYDEVPPRERRRLHARYASVYARLAPDAPDRVATHAVRALPDVDPGWVIEATTVAGQQALERLAGAEAASQFNVAVDLARRHQPSRVGKLLERLGEARALAGDRAAAVAAYDEAIDRLGPDGDPLERARLQLVAAKILYDAEQDASDVHVGLGLEALGPSPATERAIELRLELLLVAATNAHRRGDSAGVETMSRQIIDQDPPAVGEQARALVTAARLVRHLQRCEYREADHDLQTGDLLRGGPELRARQHFASGIVAACKGDLVALRAANTWAVAAARRTGIPAWHARVSMGVFLDAFFSADWERADEVIDDLDRSAAQITHPGAAMVARVLAAMMAAYRAEFDAAHGLVRTLVDVGNAAPRTVINAFESATAGMIEIERGDAHAALVQLERLVVMPSSGSLPPWDMVAKGEALARTGHTAGAELVARDLDAMTGPGTYTGATATRIRGLAAIADGRVDEALARLDESSRLFAGLGMPFEEGRAGIELAELAVRSKRAGPDLPGRLGGWNAVFQRLRAPRYAARSQRLLAALGHPVVPEVSPGDLTPRQLEIADLVARGLTNAEIAEELFLSVRTVTSHLDHIYTRLGINSRAALAAFVVARHGPPAAAGARQNAAVAAEPATSYAILPMPGRGR